MSDNLPEVLSALKAWQKRMDKAGMEATRLITHAVLSKAQEITHATVNKPTQRNGKLRYNPHIGSRSGEGPNYVTGNLYRGIIAQPIRRQGFESYVATVGSSVFYARTVEEGASNWNGVKYPYMVPARDYVVNSGMARRYIISEVQKAMGG